jgi:trimeric autotransporter adhesin
VPLPGVSVTATNTLTGKKYASTTDIDGAFQMDVPRNGRYVVKTELAGFASVTQEVVVNKDSQNGGLPVQTAEFKMDLASRVTPEPAATLATTARPGAGPVAAPGTAAPGTTAAGTTTTPRTRTTGAVARQGRTTQTLTMQGEDDTDLTDATAGDTSGGAQLPTMGGLASGDDTSALSSDSIAVTGNQGQINGLAGFSQDELQMRIQGMQQQGLNNGDIAGTLSTVMQSGTFGGPGGGPGGFGGPGGGGPGGGGPGGGGPGGGGFAGGGGRGGGGGGRGGGGGFGGGGFGGFRGQNPNAWHGRISYTGADSALNANNYSVTGTPVPKPQSDRNTYIATVQGTPFIPHLLAPNPKENVFLSVQGTKNSSPSILQTIVPTQAQLWGDLTPAYQAAWKSGIVEPIYDPNTLQPYGNTNCAPQLAQYDPNHTACIPLTELQTAASVAAQKLLATYYPAPNITPTQTGDNYQASFPGTSDSSQISARFNRSFGSAPVRGGRGGFGGGGGRGGGGGQNRNAPPTLRQSIAENFAYSHTASASESFSQFLSGKTVSDGYSLSSGYTVGYGRLNSTATLSWNRSAGESTNYYTNNIAAGNPAQTAGIDVGNSTIYSNPFYYGVPSISIAGGYQGLSDPTPSNTINQTISFSDFVSWTHKRHNMRYGVDFHRIHADSIGGTNVLGQFTFSGYATQLPAGQTYNCTLGQASNPTCATGSGFADYLLGLPQSTGITAGLNKIYLRGNSWDWYVNDDWRAKSNVTIEYGLRWEYFSPYSEKYGRLVNLNLTGSAQAGTLAISNICGTAAPAGSVTGACAAISPGTLVKPDKSMYSPRVAIRWAPKSKFTKQTVLNASYGINYNTGQYSRFAQKLAFQYPFAVTQANVVGTNGCTAQNLTLPNGFGCSTQQTTLSNYAVDPNYRLGMVQIYNFGIQRTLPQQIVLNINYTGAFSGNLDMLRAPNRTNDGLIQQSAGQFTYEDSLGYQRSNALAISAGERLHKGVALQAVYTYSHSIDDASSIGGSGSSIAQNDQDLGAEESNSSFDVRHKVSGNFVIEPPFGPNRAFLNKGGVLAKILDGYSISGAFTFATGNYATPTYSLTPSEIAAGAPSSLRPNRAPGQSITGPQTHLEWFNTAAFVNAPLDAKGNPEYGNASRNSIELPGTVSLSGSLSRTISFGETRSMELRLNAANALNTVQYSGVGTTINSPQTYGFVTSAAAMRSFTYNLMYRF